ncbi:hypothetical protein AN191_03760 [Loktanella sp. 5RATIMAR09]|nr:hypothetical protein AN191_03760 [Loktanella sp. 5RATIMAR09]
MPGQFWPQRSTPIWAEGKAVIEDHYQAKSPWVPYVPRTTMALRLQSPARPESCCRAFQTIASRAAKVGFDRLRERTARQSRPTMNCAPPAPSHLQLTQKLIGMARDRPRRPVAGEDEILMTIRFQSASI